MIGVPFGGRRPIRHGLSKSREHRRTYASWMHMRSRCLSPGDVDYANYGGRGISICDRWDDYSNFFADMGLVPPGLSLDRINNDGNYEPGNCRWATMKTQSNNRRHNPIHKLESHEPAQIQWLFAQGFSKAEIGRFFEIDPITVRWHIRRVTQASSAPQGLRDARPG